MTACASSGFVLLSPSRSRDLETNDMSIAELKNALVHGSQIVVAIGYVYAGILVAVYPGILMVAALVKRLWKK